MRFFNHVKTHCHVISRHNCVTLVLLELTGLKDPMIREAVPFPSTLLVGSSFLSPSFFKGGSPYDTGFINEYGKKYIENLL